MEGVEFENAVDLANLAEQRRILKEKYIARRSQPSTSPMQGEITPTEGQQGRPSVSETSPLPPCSSSLPTPPRPEVPATTTSASAAPAPSTSAAPRHASSSSLRGNAPRPLPATSDAHLRSSRGVVLQEPSSTPSRSTPVAESPVPGKGKGIAVEPPKKKKAKHSAGVLESAEVGGPSCFGEAKEVANYVLENWSLEHDRTKLAQDNFPEALMKTLASMADMVARVTYTCSVATELTHFGEASELKDKKIEKLEQAVLLAEQSARKAREEQEKRNGENIELQAALQQMRKEKNTMAKEVIHLRNESHLFKTELENATSHAGLLEDKLENTERRYASLEHELELSNQRVAELQPKVQAMEKTIQEEREKAKKLKVAFTQAYCAGFEEALDQALHFNPSADVVPCDVSKTLEGGVLVDKVSSVAQAREPAPLSGDPVNVPEARVTEPPIHPAEPLSQVEPITIDDDVEEVNPLAVVPYTAEATKQPSKKRRRLHKLGE